MTVLFNVQSPLFLGDQKFAVTIWAVSYTPRKLSLRDYFREGLLDSESKPRLNYARNYFLGFSLDKDLDFNELEKFYVDWREFIEYIVL